MKGKIKYLFLHGLLIVYSFCGVFSKLAAGTDFLSVPLLLLGIYAVFWQQILKHFALTEAFFNKAVIVIWGMVWGALFFGEQITVNMVIGAVILIIGIRVLARDYE